jgi:hypothetical protein
MSDNSEDEKFFLELQAHPNFPIIDWLMDWAEDLGGNCQHRVSKAVLVIKCSECGQMALSGMTPNGSGEVAIAELLAETYQRVANWKEKRDAAGKNIQQDQHGGTGENHSPRHRAGPKPRR